MKILTKYPPSITMLIMALLIGSACSVNMDGSDGDHINHQVSPIEMNSGQESRSNILESIPTKKNISPPEGMLLFEGRVFVASTEPSKGRWHQAGWQIASRSMAIADHQVPMDCTLYPHQGVEDQWIGSCSGNTYIPKDGASHIAVMHTSPDGNTILIQVAPTPDSGIP